MEKVGEKVYSGAAVVSACLTKKLTFAAYRLPGNKEITLVIQKDNVLNTLADLSEIPEPGGFVVSPFTDTGLDKSYIIHPDIIIRDQASSSQMDAIRALNVSSLNGVDSISPEETKKEDFLRQIEQTLQEIKSGEFDKVVLSRVKIVSGNFSSQLINIFEMLCDSYSNACVYLFQMKGQCWAGATPEPLICTKGNELETVSLAGTRPYNEENLNICNWNSKERMEQEYVTQYIEKVFSDYQIDDYQKKGPYTKKAGKLLHLRTDFRFLTESIGRNLSVLVGALHPTSAVCGMPMEKSRNYIHTLEKHNREYYAGFLGPVGIDGQLQLFVNLRCMKVLENKLALYVGSGITADSDPEEEWEETEIKADTLLSVIQQIY